MVIALLLSDPSKPLRHQDLGRAALQCLQGVHSMWKALSIFQSAMKGLETPSTILLTTLPSRLLSAFDAHVGDCSCQTRAQMLWELVQFYNTPEKGDTLKRAVTLLQEIRIQAALLLQEIEQSRGKRRTPALDALKTHSSIWQRIGFTQFLDVFYRPSGSPFVASTLQVTATGGTLARPQNSSHKHRQITVEAGWDPCNLFLVARFLTFCSLLSQCKKAKIEDGPPIRVVVRVDLQSTYAEIGQELEALSLLPAQSNVKPYDGNVKMNAQCDAMQGYVSIVTTDWASKEVFKLGLFDFHQSLSEGLIAANSRRISCVAIYASMLLIRSAWLMLDTPLLVVIQRFCSHGELHNIYCRVIRNSKKQTSLAASLCEMGEPNWFNVTLVSGEDVVASPWARLPHVIMMCMSGEGTIEDFRHVLLESNLGKLHTSQPHNGTCREIAHYISKLNEVNFARLLAHYFAHHKQFPFTLLDQENTFEMLFELIQKGLGKKASDIFKGARDGADEFGTGKSMGMFTIDHILLEFPGVILKELKEKPTVYGCKLES